MAVVIACRVVAPAVAGSSPVAHPKLSLSRPVLAFFSALTHRED
jgi:hypothetical protein